MVAVVNRFLRFWNRRNHYRRCFTNEAGHLTSDGEAVLRDLAAFCRADRSVLTLSPVTRTVDTHATMVAEGRREVFVRILQILRMTDAQINSLKSEDRDDLDEADAR